MQLQSFRSIAPARHKSKAANTSLGFGVLGYLLAGFGVLGVLGGSGLDLLAVRCLCGDLWKNECIRNWLQRTWRRVQSS